MVEQVRGDVTAAVRGKIAAGTLPLDPPTKVWVGHGDGRPCAACDLPVSVADVEYEVDLAETPPLRFHQKCLAVWHEERARHTNPDR